MKLLFSLFLILAFTSLKAQDNSVNTPQKQAFIYVLRLTEKYQDEKNWTAETGKIMGEHVNYMKNLYQEGTSKMIGRTDLETNSPNLIGLNIFLAENLEAAKKIANNDPSVKNGIMRVEVFPFKIVFGQK